MLRWGRGLTAEVKKKTLLRQGRTKAAAGDLSP